MPRSRQLPIRRRAIAVATFAAIGLLLAAPVARPQSEPAPGVGTVGRSAEGAATGNAQTEPPPDASAVHQYVEAVPTSGGSSTPGMTKETRIPLPAKAKRSLEKSSSAAIAKALEEVATSSTYGAPSVSPAKTDPTLSDSPFSEASTDSVLDSAVGVAATTGDSRLLGLLAVLIATTAGAVVLAFRQTRV